MYKKVIVAKEDERGGPIPMVLWRERLLPFHWRRIVCQASASRQGKQQGPYENFTVLGTLAYLMQSNEAKTGLVTDWDYCVDLRRWMSLSDNIFFYDKVNRSINHQQE